jgi:hypothetical protein
MTLDAHARASTQAIDHSRTRLDPVAGLDDLLRRRRRRPVGRAAITVATATMVAVVALVGTRELQPPATVTQPPGSLGRVTATIAVGFGPADILVSQGAVWVAAGQGVVSRADQGTVSRIDPATGTETSGVGVGPAPRLGAGFGSIWAANNDPAGISVSRIDPRTGQVTATIPIPVTAPAVKPTQLAVGAGWIIASDVTANQLLRIDPATNQAARSTRLAGRWAGSRSPAGWSGSPGGTTPGPASSFGSTRPPTGSPTRSRPPGTARSPSAGAASGRPGSPPRPSTG